MNRFKTEPAGTVLAGPAYHRLTPPLPRFLSLPLAPSRCPPGPTSPGPACQPLTPLSLAPCRPPLSRGNSAARARWPRDDANCPTCPRHNRGPLSPPFSPPRDAEPRNPCPLFPLRPRHRAAIRTVADLALLFSPFFFSIRSLCRRLPAPHRDCPRRPWSPHRLTTGRPSHPRRRVSASSVSRSSMHRGLCLTLSLSLWHCRTPAPAPPMTGAPQIVL
jgi:hypothetical protein